MERPNPAPATPPKVVLRSRSNGSNARPTKSALMPIPVSLTRISYAPYPSRLASGFCVSDKSTRPFGGVKLIAFVKRLMKI